ncbi:MAG: hypothetical protein L3J63_06140 [Geopsychrobacter sp.]|nr:hypothetical protein [Geopsychrobacter sp.]
MKKLQFFLLLTVFFGFMTTSAFAASINQNGSTSLTGGQQQAATGATKVPQAQIDRVNKRAAMNAKRAEMLKVRQQLIDTNNPGNVNGQQTIQ